MQSLKINSNSSRLLDLHTEDGRLVKLFSDMSIVSVTPVDSIT